MPIKTAFLAALVLATLQLSGANVYAADGRNPAAPIATTDPDITGALPAPAAANAAPDASVFHPGRGSAGDIVGARGPNPHARELTQIAIYASIGNTDGVAMLTSQLRARGVSHETIRRAVNRINVHGEGFTAPMPGRDRKSSRADAGWQATQ